MRFDTYLPCNILQPYVKIFAISETAEENIYKVLPDTSLVSGFQYKGRLVQLLDKQQVELNSAGLTGLQARYRMYKNTADTGSVLVYFKEAGAVHFFKHPIHELFGESISLEHFILRSELLILEEQLYNAATDLDRIRVVEQFLIARMQQIEPDPLVLAALAIIYKNNGNIRIKDLLELLHTSQSPLEKRFRQVVGASPKKFAAIVRFKYTLQRYNAQHSFTELGFDAGFYDQAHFIKTFKNFTGETPESFFSTS